MEAGTPMSDVREKYLAFFERNGHTRIPSARLVPENDPTTLFTGSGMQPMIAYLLGQKHPSGTRITDSQKCFRLNDIDDIGDNRHTTFFEMLGNWSLGNYFKEKQIPWMFEFLTKELGLNPANLYVTVFAGNADINIPRDDESAALWQKMFASAGIDAKVVDNAAQEGMQGGRIFTYDEQKNWWSRAGVPANMPVGEPGGPDTEMFWDFGAEKQLHENSPYKDTACHVNCDCGRFIEIGNNVFMQYRKTETGFEPLPQKNVDFGGGLERITAALNNNPDVFQIDVFQPMMSKLQEISGVAYSSSEDATKAYRVILDHVRAATFLIGDGIVPGKKDQEYFVRRLIRRAVRYASKLGIKKPFISDMAGFVVLAYQKAYPDLSKQATRIYAELSKEEEKFLSTLEKGTKKFNELLLKIEPTGMVSGASASLMYRSFGFPIEIITEMAEEQGKKVDVKAFEEEGKAHEELSRTASAGKFKGGLADHSDMSVKYHTATHLLHKALREVLGDHVLQKGSNITPERLRFDFSHPEKMTPEQIAAVENLVNEQIARDLSVTREEMSVEEAKKRGALGLFEHKYGDTVSVYTMGDFSCEICGGPHVEHTGTLGKFSITKEESASSGVRRIKAVLT